jgi:hypothetical protein
MDFLLRNPSEGHDSRSHPFNHSFRVWGQTEGPVKIAIGHVHQDGLRHIVEVVPKCDDVCPDAVGKVVDALAAEHAAIGAWKSRGAGV